MAGDILKVGQLKPQQHYVPLPYRCVSFQPYDGLMDAAVIEQELLKRASEKLHH